MSYYAEVWLRGFAKDYLRRISRYADDNYHPHITLVRPFTPLVEESELRERIISVCKNFEPIFFTLKGLDYFDGSIPYLSVVNNVQLLDFNNRLESALDGYVRFKPKLADEKKLHVTIDGLNQNPEESIDQYLLRLTMIRDKKIWFSWDFVTQSILSREDSLNKSKWHYTVELFSKQYGLRPTKNGFQKINE